MQAGAAALPDEDGWYDTEKWDALKKSPARQMDPVGREERSRQEARDKEQDRAQGEWARSGASTGASEKRSDDVEWMKVGGSEVCLPKDTKKPLTGPRFNGVVHFIGGVFVGTVPKLAYKKLIEQLVSKGRVVVVATPVGALTGMDHYKAAYEAAFRFTSACTALKGELGEGVFDADDYPTIGVAHSLGCKVQLLLGSIADARDAAGRPRAANVHLAFNNFDAKKSIPVLDELRQATQGLSAAAPVLEQISAAADGLRNSEAFKDLLGGKDAQKAFDFLDTVKDISKAAAENARGGVAEEFSPSPEDTLRLITEEYPVSRNLCVKFISDDIDQSVALCTVLRDKFTGPAGSGGRLDLKRLGGSHVTPNTPDINVDEFRGNLGAAGAAFPGFEDLSREKAEEVLEQLDALTDTVVAFILEEAARDAGPRSRTRLPA